MIIAASNSFTTIERPAKMRKTATRNTPPIKMVTPIRTPPPQTPPTQCVGCVWVLFSANNCACQ